MVSYSDSCWLNVYCVKEVVYTRPKHPMLFRIPWSSLSKKIFLSIWIVGSLMIQKQASALGRGLLLRNCTLIVSLSPIRGIFVNPVINDRISSSVALRQLESVRYWKNQSYTFPSLSSAGFGVDTNLTSISGVSGQLASYKRNGFIRSEFSCNILVIFKQSSPRLPQWHVGILLSSAPTSQSSLMQLFQKIQISMHQHLHPPPH